MFSCQTVSFSRVSYRVGMANRFLLDSMIHDKLVDEPRALQLAADLAANGSLVLLSTHIQRDEIAKTPDKERATLLSSVPVEFVPTYGIVAGISRVGMARLSESEPFETLRGGNLDHTEDALIAATAHYEDATLVTEDQTLASRARKQDVPVLSWGEFYSLMLESERS